MNGRQVHPFGGVDNLSDGQPQPVRKTPTASALADPFDSVDDLAEPGFGHVGREQRPFVMVQPLLEELQHRAQKVLHGGPRLRVLLRRKGGQEIFKIPLDRLPQFPNNRLIGRRQFFKVPLFHSEIGDGSSSPRDTAPGPIL